MMPTMGGPSRRAGCSFDGTQLLTGIVMQRYLGNVRSGVKRLKETVKDLRAEIVTLKEDNAALLEVRSSPSIQTYELAVESVSFSRVRVSRKARARRATKQSCGLG